MSTIPSLGQRERLLLAAANALDPNGGYYGRQSEEPALSGATRGPVITGAGCRTWGKWHRFEVVTKGGRASNPASLSYQRLSSIQVTKALAAKYNTHRGRNRTTAHKGRIFCWSLKMLLLRNAALSFCGAARLLTALIDLRSYRNLYAEFGCGS